MIRTSREPRVRTGSILWVTKTCRLEKEEVGRGKSGKTGAWATRLRRGGMRLAPTRTAKGRQLVEGRNLFPFWSILENEKICFKKKKNFVFENLTICRPPAFRGGTCEASRMSSTFRNIMSDVNYGIR